MLDSEDRKGNEAVPGGWDAGDTDDANADLLHDARDWAVAERGAEAVGSAVAGG